MSATTAITGWPTQPKRGWLPGEIELDTITHVFSDGERAALLELAVACRADGLALEQITRERFSHPRLDPVMSALQERLRQGPGLVFLKNLPYAERPIDEIKLMYWGIGTHLGRAVSQNKFGEIMGEVRVRPDAIKNRAYGHSGALILHCDRIDMLSLFCVSKPVSGGANLFVSSLKIWDIIAEERPDLLPALLEGYRQHRNGEQYPGEPAATPYRAPIFAEVDGLRSALFSGNAVLSHQEQAFGDELTPHRREALEFLTAVRDRPELALRHTLELGEAVFINNYEILHNREAFQDGETPEQKRLLLRLWLEGVPPRPKPAEMIIMRNPSGRQGMDPWPAEALAAAAARQAEREKASA